MKRSCNILIVGDWFVDEYWFIASHYSDIASHKGTSYYRIINKPEEPVRALCGAGHIARALFLFRERDKNNYKIYGIGHWNNNDTDIIKHLIHAQEKKEEEGKSLACFSLMPQLCKVKSKDIDINLTTLRPEYPTIRIIRQYQRQKGKKDSEFKQINRVDWEPNYKLLKSLEKYERKDKVEDIANKTKLPKKDETVAIVIDDRTKGVIDDDLINELQSYYCKASWYIRSKDNKLSLLGKVDNPIDIVFLGPELASRKYPFVNLLFNEKEITAQAFDLIEKITKDTNACFTEEQYKIFENKLTDDQKNLVKQFKTEKKKKVYINLNEMKDEDIEKLEENYHEIMKHAIKNIVLSSDEREVIAIVNGCKQCITGQSHEEKTTLNMVSWATAIFASLIHAICKKDEQDISKGDIASALASADKYSGVRIPDSMKDKVEKFDEEKFNEEKSKKKYELKTHSIEWKGIRKKWKDAKKNYGIIEEDTKDGEKKISKKLEVWRSYTDLPGYITCIGKKRELISRIWQKLREFKSPGKQMRSLSILLQADPGAGKTFLAGKLAEVIDFSFIHHDITQMIHREELLDLFDIVASKQVEKNSNVLVFVDEINASLDGSNVYGAFLAPIESGYYMRRGVKLSLKPCIWMFAGTEFQTGEKLEDFKDRMTMKEKIDYNSLKSEYGDLGSEKLDNEARLEQVYLGAKLINDCFSDVKQISEDVLKKFHELDPSKNPIRKIRKLAVSLQNLQYGRVKKSNCMTLEWQDVLKDLYKNKEESYSDWYKGEEKEEDFVELIF